MTIENKITDLITKYAQGRNGNYLSGNQCVLVVRHHSQLQKLILHFNMDSYRKLDVALSFEKNDMQVTVEDCCLTGFEFKDCIQLFSDWHMMLSILQPNFLQAYKDQ